MSLIFECPTTGAAVRSGLPFDARTLAVARNIRLYVRCDCCGEEHRFSVKDAKPAMRERAAA